MKTLILYLILIPSLAFAAIPEGAKTYLPVLKEVINSYWKDLTYPHIPAGQVEQESSWKVKAKLETSRELGRGLAQITITPRFNTYLTALQYKPLKDWNWKEDPYNPKCQLTYQILQDRDNYNQVKRFFIDDDSRIRAMLISYNAGYGRVLKRHQYAVAKGTRHDTWVNGLDGVHDNSEEKLLYGRPLYQAINEYPILIFKKSEKYKPYF